MPRDNNKDAGERPVRVAIADSDPLARRVVRRELERHETLRVVAETGAAAEIAACRTVHGADVVVLDPRLSAGDGGTLVARVGREAPGLAVLVFGSGLQDDAAIAVLRAGAHGVLAKERGVDALPAAIHAIVRGEAAVPRGLTLRIIELLRAAPDDGAGLRPVRSSLTTREWEVLDQLCAGRSTREIAEALVLSEDTVYSHVKNIMRKLGVHTRAEAVARAGELRGRSTQV